MKKQVEEWKKCVKKDMSVEFTDGFSVDGKLVSLNDREIKIRELATNKILSFSTEKVKKMTEMQE
jgi:hypothetical protein